MQGFNLRTLFLVNSIVAIAFALGFLLGPATLLQLFGLSTGNTEKLVAQLFGSALVAFGLLTWFARDVTDNTARNGIVLSLFFSDVVAVVITVLATLSRVMRTGGWTAVVVFLIFAVGYGYFQFFNKSAQ